MAAPQNKLLRLVPAPSETGGLLAQALVDLYKAVKGAAFYPHGHPYRTEPLQRACEALQRLVAERELVLNVNRQGFAPGGDGADVSIMVQQLAHECLIRRVSCVTFLPDLTAADLEIFVDLLCGDPYKTSYAGGIAKQLEDAGARTVWINEKDLAAIWAKRGAADADPAEPAQDDWEGIEALETGGDSLWEEQEVPVIRELLTLMAAETDDTRYQSLGRQLIESFRLRPADMPVPAILEELLRQHRDQLRTLPQREYALFALERVADEATDPLLDLLESRDCPDKEGLYRIFAVLGVKGAYWIIQRLCLAEGVFERKALATALVRLGPAAVAPVIGMLKDQRWYVVRNMVTILGELRAPESVAALRKPLFHYDMRVRKEAVRALMKIGGDAAETTLMTLLDDPDEVFVRHAILSLGLMHSRQAVPALIKLLERRDFLLKGLALKKELVVALGRIGDRRATPLLLRLLKTRGWPVFGRWQELRSTVATALGVLGDESALPPLNALAARSGILADACREAVDAIERVSGEL